jgi:hypothetical protein
MQVQNLSPESKRHSVMPDLYRIGQCLKVQDWCCSFGSAFRWTRSVELFSGFWDWTAPHELDSGHLFTEEALIQLKEPASIEPINNSLTWL